MKICLVACVVGLMTAAPATAQTALTGQAAKLFQQAIDTGHFYSAAAKLKPEVWPTSDGKSFLVVWKTTPAPPAVVVGRRRSPDRLSHTR